MSIVPVPMYRGPFGKAQAERLLWRAGFGARTGEAEELAKLGLKHAVYSMTRPGAVPARRARAEGRAQPRRSRRPTPSATTTSRGSTGWCGRPRRRSSG